ncbi:MAG: chromosome segregation protein SMC, partial [Pelosinus sp.]|nr:chromosome segregation protein SMC [Pelosinus sp.]
MNCCVVKCLLLRKLEAYGFKSFADKTEIDFGEGITVVVGPNGSGKSNISDAIRWALGEQSIRDLRGTKSEDVIFAGSAGRRALGVAEVSLVFDNSDGSLPLDFNEVTITRRVFRSGESEYFINKSHCRLKDIHELLAGTGLGRDAMPVIGQNKVDEVLNSKPEERRLLFEEAAGITKYKQRKREALRRLDDTKQNLTRVYDIIGEIETQLEPLGQSAQRTKKYNEFHQELVACQVTLLLHKLENAEKMVESAGAQQQLLRDEELAASTKVAVDEAEIERLTASASQATERIDKLEEAINQANTELERMDGKAAVLEERMKQGQLNKGRLAEQMQRIEQQKAELQQKLTGLEISLQAKCQQAALFEGNLAKQEAAYEQNVTLLKARETQLNAAQEQTFGHLQEIVGERNRLSTTERDMVRVKARQDHISKQQQEYQVELARAEENATHIAAESEILAKALCSINEKKQSLVMEQRTIDQEIMVLIAEDKKVSSNLQELTSRSKILSSMQHEYEGFGRGIKTVLKSSAPWRSGVCGAVAELLKVPDKYVTAVEIALGGALQHIVVQRDDIAKEAINFLKRQNSGRATFLPLNTIRPMRPRETDLTAARASGAFGLAKDLVKIAPEYQSVVDFLLGRTVIAENIDAAMKIARDSGFLVKIVTLEGELLNPGGSMTGGSTHRKEASFLSRHNEIEAIAGNIAATKDKLAALNNRMDAAKTARMAAAEQIKQNEAKHQETLVRQAELKVHADKMQVERQRLLLAVQTLSTELNTSRLEYTQFAEKITAVKEHIAVLENRDSAHKQQVNLWQDEAKHLAEAKEKLNNKLTESKIQITALNQEIMAIRQQLQQHQQTSRSIGEERQRIIDEQEENSTQTKLSVEELIQLGSQRIELHARKQASEDTRGKEYESKMSTLTKLQQQEKELREFRRRYNEIQSRLHEIELIITKYSYELNNSQDQ